MYLKDEFYYVKERPTFAPQAYIVVSMEDKKIKTKPANTSRKGRKKATKKRKRATVRNAAITNKDKE